MTRLLITLLLLCTMGAKAQTSQTLADFNARKAVLTHGHLFDIFHRPMTDGERDAMCFLYAYMPVNDIADYDGDFFLSQVRATLNVRTQVGWQVPDEVFRHFVLPIREPRYRTPGVPARTSSTRSRPPALRRRARSQPLVP